MNAWDKEHIADEWSQGKWEAFLDSVDKFCAAGGANELIEELKADFENEYATGWLDDWMAGE